MRAAVLGASGYAGTELLRLITQHPELSVVLATGDRAAGQSVGAHRPALAAAYPDLIFGAHEDVRTADVDVVFLALPHGASQRWVPDLVARGCVVVDLGADFRLADKNDYTEWYGGTHAAPHLLGTFEYGLVERHRPALVGSTRIAVPGCYPTATSLTLGPFLDRAVVAHDGVVVTGLSGLSGAGRGLADHLHFPEAFGNVSAYGLTQHRHTIEMQ